MQRNENISGGGLGKRLLIRTLLATATIFVLFFLLPKVIGLTVPFVIVFIVATAINPLMKKVRNGISRRIIAILLNLLIFIAISSLIGAVAYYIAKDITTLANNLQTNWDSIEAKLQVLEQNLMR